MKAQISVKMTLNYFNNSYTPKMLNEYYWLHNEATLKTGQSGECLPS